MRRLRSVDVSGASPRELQWRISVEWTMWFATLLLAALMLLMWSSRPLAVAGCAVMAVGTATSAVANRRWVASRDHRDTRLAGIAATLTGIGAVILIAGILVGGR